MTSDVTLRDRTGYFLALRIVTNVPIYIRRNPLWFANDANRNKTEIKRAVILIWNFIWSRPRPFIAFSIAFDRLNHRTRELFFFSNGAVQVISSNSLTLSLSLTPLIPSVPIFHWFKIADHSRVNFITGIMHGR